MISSAKAVLCDGHGPEGHVFAQTVVDFQMASSTTNLNDLFKETDEHLRTTISPKHSSTVSGTTCSFLSFDDETRTIHAGNVGDSTIRYWDTVGDGVSVSYDHSPTDVSEYQRVLAAGGVCLFHDNTNRYLKGKQPIFTQKESSFVLNTGGSYYIKNVRKDPAAYLESPPSSFEYGHKPRLAMTRSFGDWILSPYGLISTPNTTTLPYPTEGVTRAIVMASDGLWDVALDNAIGAIVRDPVYLDSRDSAGATAALMDLALDSGRKLFGPHVDNISIVVAYI